MIVWAAKAAGLVSLPVSVVMLRDYLVLKKQKKSIDEILASPLACTGTRWYRLMTPILFQIDPETAHTGALHSGQFLGSVLSVFQTAQKNFRSMIFKTANFLVGDSRLVVDETKQSRLTTTVNGVTYRSPIGLSAGFDKNGRLSQFFFTSNLISHCEIGSVSYYPWHGNPKPRLFRLPEDKAVINRMGLNNDGAEIVANRLCETVGGGCVKIGVNITKTPDSTIEGEDAVADFVKSYNFMRYIDTIDWITLNISCPNTAEGKTFEDVGALTSLLSALTGTEDDGVRKPIHIKVAPIASNKIESWKEDARKIFEIAKKFNVSALVIANTVPDRDFKSPPLKSSPSILGERGGLSGRPIFERSIPLIQEAYKNDLTVVGVGGVFTGSDAYRLIRSGASLVQLYTAMVFEGPWVFRDIENGLERHLVLDGISNVQEAVGIDVRN